MKKKYIYDFLLLFLIVIMFFLLRYSIESIPIILIIAFVIASVKQMYILTEFNIATKILMIIGNAIVAFGVFLIELNILKIIITDGGFFPYLGHGILAFIMGYINFGIVFPKLLSSINTLKQKDASKSKYIKLLCKYLLISLVVEIPILLVLLSIIS